MPEERKRNTRVFVCVVCVLYVCCMMRGAVCCTIYVGRWFFGRGSVAVGH